ncbi:MAG: HAD family phosphatase [Patescibacteria group bacterium]
MNLTPTAIIFDMDGVIVDTEPLCDLYEIEFLTRLGVNEPGEPPANRHGLNSRAYWAPYKKEYGLKPTVDELIMLWRPGYLAYLDGLTEIPLIPGIKKLLDYLTRTDIKLALCSSANPKRVELILNKVSLKDYFPIIVHGDDVINSKPAPDSYLLAAARLNVPPSECLVIEDAANGIKAAIAAGMSCVAYAGSPHNTDDLSEAHVIIDDFDYFNRSLYILDNPDGIGK